MVNVGFPEPARYGFETVDGLKARHHGGAAINRKFTPNRMIRNFGEVSANLAQCEHLRFIDRC
jgi:hypothetical protein